MAAPETASLRRLRIAVIALAATTAIGIVAIGPIISFVGRAVAGGSLAALIASYLMAGAVYVVRKAQTDDRWSPDRGFDGEGEAA
ncbi:hypothetical protein [Sphingomonas sp. SUN039]|uniref:hypothetical protein n=1 Tax=Sphingomonas sp. SUN039 TaxID=2937787 RepID=UPI00216492B7|nr:hypothetical protein [Sphingomonas sp. SUN039]UVO53792.1 hypothetical protein M0209_06530 [Sphingomonas sp. SUN039]